MALKTLGFVSVVHLNGHYQKHGSNFGCADENQYEAMADEFLGGPKQSSVLECVRGRGDLCRFDMLTEAYGILSAKGEIRTFYKPIPCASVPIINRAGIESAGLCHPNATNLLYFKAECARW